MDTMLTKGLLFFSILLLVCTSCEERGECCTAPWEIAGRFEHQITDCEPGDNFQVNCIEFVDFIHNTEADLVYGGGDILFRFTYRIEGDKIILEREPTSSFALPFFFRIIDSETLERSDNGDLWKKER